MNKMCLYWKKLHTCGHLSDRPYVEMCKPGYFSNTICSDIGEDDKPPRKSHFPCWLCIKGEAHAEAEANARAQQEAVVKAQEAREVAVREKQAAEQRAKEERIRRAAREKAAREREEDVKQKAMVQMEQERAKKEGGLWIETGSGKKQKSKKGAGYGSGNGFPTMPASAPPVLKTFAAKDKKENEGSPGKSPKKGLETGGRAGTWGPKKILSRKDGAGAMK